MPEHDPRQMVDKVRSDYNLIAREWDLSRPRPSQVKLNLLGKIEEGMLVLDIGCGNGVVAPFIVEKGAYYAGIDIAENLVAIARERYRAEIAAGTMRFAVGDATELPFPDREFDYVVSFAVLHHIPSPELRRKFFAQMQRVLRPNCRAKLTVWNLRSEWASSRFDIGTQLAGAESGDVTIPWRGTQGRIVNRYVHQFSEAELYALADGAGFFDTRISYYDRAGQEQANGEEMVLEMRA